MAPVIAVRLDIGTTTGPVIGRSKVSVVGVQRASQGVGANLGLLLMHDVLS